MAIMKKGNIDAFLATATADVFYLSGIDCEDSLFMLCRDGSGFFITDSRYVEEAKSGADGIKVILRKKSLSCSVGVIARKEKIYRIGVGKDDITYGAYQALLENSGRHIVPSPSPVKRMRAVKDKHEMAAIRKSIEMTGRVLLKLRSSFVPGVKEKDVYSDAVFWMNKMGAKPSFDPVVAFAPNSSKPHAKSGLGVLTAGTPGFIDLGVRLNGYCSDLTRPFFAGSIKPRAQKVLSVLITAQKRAIRRISDGVSVAAVDKSARDYISKAGYGKYFGHALGHGVGIEVHEAPLLSGNSKEILRAGMVVTVEPGIYIPGWGGIRVEEMVLVKRKGCDVLSYDID